MILVVVTQIVGVPHPHSERMQDTPRPVRKYNNRQK